MEALFRKMLVPTQKPNSKSKVMRLEIFTNLTKHEIKNIQFQLSYHMCRYREDIPLISFFIISSVALKLRNLENHEFNSVQVFE